MLQADVSENDEVSLPLASPEINIFTRLKNANKNVVKENKILSY